MEKNVAYMVSAAMKYAAPQDPKKSKGRLVVNGWWIVKIKRNLFRREKFEIIAGFKKYTEAIAALNKIYGL